MKVEILQTGTVIGRCNLDPVDPPMGVAAGQFEPTSDYDPQLHASTTDGICKELGDDAPLSDRSEEFGIIDCTRVAIEDYNKSLGELQVLVLGIGYPDYETFFASHPSYKAYWS
ncbi:hypothetical protein [Rhizobium sp. RCC_161_2]|uniref:hypothetical protein n=1 Tax=Rhizobium sp. RCC_161_2 TaxID=3239219 RepID=UPI003525011E